MIHRELQIVKVLSFGGVDAYGQKNLAPEEREVEMFMRPYSQNIIPNPLYNEVEMVGLTRDRNITDKNEILVDNVKYKVLYTIDSRRWNTLLMRKV